MEWITREKAKVGRIAGPDESDLYGRADRGKPSLELLPYDAFHAWCEHRAREPHFG
jgi:hypothetical protein